ncbi:sigma-70 family RNA polymerase sigma factor [Cellulosilyticum sp. I15G10I2]|uniref:sigma-70 family RNA polymerase sigma factor n=1 Tax=Cellulosilyticum sp. I15G10I2 TaxID=1892843 RepID=UPI00085C56C3|nr:sigma-70 family RNA polymerase sigma factor [Cellulosilyticum sp. I15G10I2]
MDNEELVKIYQQGDAKALDTLLERNKRMVYMMANKFYVVKSNSIDEEDLIQEGYIGLMIAARKYRFDNDRRAKFMTYAIHWIYSKMNRFIKQKNTNEETSLNRPTNDDDIELIDIMEDKSFNYDQVEESLYYQEIREELDQVMNEELTLGERMAIKLNFGWDGECMSLDQIASMYEGEDKQRTIITKTRALAKLRRSSWARKEWEIRRREREYIY